MFMKWSLFWMISFAVLLGVLGPMACHRESGPPPPLAVEQIPAEVQKEFSKAAPEVKEIVGQLTSTLQAKEYSAAFQSAQALVNLPVATKEQRMVSLRAMMTIQDLLKAAQAQGDQKAAEVLTLQRTTK
jgi:hypothetical protein